MSDLVRLIRKCPFCGSVNEAYVESDKLKLWESGELIQKVWPEKTPDERELIKTGICSCWP